MVAANHGVRQLVGVIEADATAAVHGVHLVFVVDERVVLDDDVHRSHGADAIAVVTNGAVADGDVVARTAIEVRDADSTHHRVLGVARNGAVVNDDIVSHRQVQLRRVAVQRTIICQRTVRNGQVATDVGSTRNSCLGVIQKCAVVDGECRTVRGQHQGRLADGAIVLLESAIAQRTTCTAYEFQSHTDKVAAGKTCRHTDVLHQNAVGWSQNGHVGKQTARRTKEVGRALDDECHVVGHTHDSGITHFKAVAGSNGVVHAHRVYPDALLYLVGHTTALLFAQTVKSVRRAVAFRLIAPALCYHAAEGQYR